MDLSRQPQFAVIKAKKNGHDLIIVVDEALNQVGVSIGFPWCIVIQLSILRASSTGLCDDKESERLADVEDEINDALGNVDYYYAGRITGENKRQIFLYTREAEELNSAIAECVKKLRASGQGCQINPNFDPTWQAFRNLCAR
jgi:hypothetical protein